jgi:hydrogenase nickel incorporation protein HypA/HybF
MHELSLAQALWDQADALRRQHQAARVVSVRVGVGELSGVELASLEGAFSLLLESNGAGAVALELERVPLEAQCEACDAEFPVQRFRFVCPRCGGPRVTVLRGEHLILQQVTLEPAEDTDE